MDNLNLLHYVEQARKSGMEDNKIREGLLQSGWPASSVEEAMMKAPAVTYPQPKPKAMMSKSLALIFTVIAIAVGGYFGGAYFMYKFQNFPLWPFEAEIVVPTITPHPVVNDTIENWQTYHNDEFGYEVKYSNKLQGDLFMPDIFRISKNSESDEPLRLWIYVRGNATNMSVRELWDSLEYDYSEYEPAKETKLAGIDGVEVSLKPDDISETPPEKHILVSYQGKFYHVMSFLSGEETNQILSTFKFTK